MTRMASARKRADDFAAALDGRGSAVMSAETRSFVELVEQLRGLDGPVMREEFAADLRTRLMAAAPTELVASSDTVSRRGPATPGSKRRRGLSAAAVACVIAGTGVGVAAASQSAIPGEALYPIKRGIERLEVSTSGSEAGRGQELLDQASTRLDEVRELIVLQGDQAETPELIERALQDFTSQAGEGADSMIAAYEQDSSEQSIVELRAFADKSVGTLDELSEVAPADVRDNLTEAANVLTAIDTLARETCPTCSDLGPLQLSGDFMTLQNSAQDVADTLNEGPQGRTTKPVDRGPLPGGDRRLSPGDVQQPSGSDDQAGSPRRDTTDRPDDDGISIDPDRIVDPAPNRQPPADREVEDPLPKDRPKVDVEVNDDGVEVETESPRVRVPRVDLDDSLDVVPKSQTDDEPTLDAPRLAPEVTDPIEDALDPPSLP